MKLIVLAYHHITTNEFSGCSRLYMSKKKFELQLEHIKALNIPIISTCEEIDLNRQSDNTFVMFTFDDAYENFFINAFPILKKYDVQSVLFVPTAKIGQEIFEQDYEDYQKYTNRPQLNALRESKLVKLQPHGHSHIELGNKPNDTQKKDIELSLKYFQYKLDIIPSFFCLPYGSYNEDTLRILMNAGTKYIFTTIDGINNLATQTDTAQPVLIKRVAFKSNIEIDDFKQKIKTERIL